MLSRSCCVLAIFSPGLRKFVEIKFRLEDLSVGRRDFDFCGSRRELLGVKPDEDRKSGDSAVAPQIADQFSGKFFRLDRVRL